MQLAAVGPRLSVTEELTGESLPRRIMRRWLPRGPWVSLTIAALASCVIDLAGSGLHGQARLGTFLPPWVMVLIALPAYVVLLWRREHPLIVFGIVLAHGLLLGGLAPAFEPFAGLMVALYSVVRHCTARWTTVAIVLSTIPAWMSALFDIPSFDENNTWVTSTTALAAYAGLITATVLFARARRRTDELHDLRIRTSEAEFALRLQEDRLKIARDLHDRVSNSLAAVLFGIDSSRQVAHELPEQVGTRLQLTHDAARHALGETRELLAVLQAAPLAVPDDATPDTLAALLDQVQVTGWGGSAVEVNHVGTARLLPPAVEECATRCVLEGVANAAKYGVEAVRIDVEWGSDALDLTIRNAHGMRRVAVPVTQGGMGLGGIIGRVRDVGGSVRLDSDGAFFTLRLCLPL